MNLTIELYPIFSFHAALSEKNQEGCGRADAPYQKIQGYGKQVKKLLWMQM